MKRNHDNDLPPCAECIEGRMEAQVRETSICYVAMATSDQYSKSGQELMNVYGSIGL